MNNKDLETLARKLENHSGKFFVDDRPHYYQGAQMNGSVRTYLEGLCVIIKAKDSYLCVDINGKDGKGENFQIIAQTYGYNPLRLLYDRLITEKRTRREKDERERIDKFMNQIKR
ncbi:MAG: hypothetical protein ABIF40_04520 [archaeon]